MGKKRFKEKKYLESAGGICPYCTSTDITAPGQTEMDGMHAWQNVICESCGSEWQDVYKLVGAEEFSNNT